MFDYFINYSSCENSPTKPLYDHRQSDDLALHSRSQLRLKLDTFLSCSIITPNMRDFLSGNLKRVLDLTEAFRAAAVVNYRWSHLRRDVNCTNVSLHLIHTYFIRIF